MEFIATLWADALQLLRDTQFQLQQSLAGAIRAWRTEGSAEAFYGLTILCFFYGVLHAVGPGHGKAIVATYSLTDARGLRRGLIVAGAGALLQGIIAILLVYAGFYVLDISASNVRGVSAWLNDAGAVLIILLGGLTLIRAWRQWRRHGAASSGHDHGHDHVCDHGHHCHHDHAPDPKHLSKANWRFMVGLTAAMGCRPCTGAILVLVLCYTLGLYSAGIAGAMSMAVGTGLTVILIALLSYGARVPLAMMGLPPGLGRAGAVILGLGGATICLFGALLLTGGNSFPTLFGS